MLLSRCLSCEGTKPEENRLSGEHPTIETDELLEKCPTRRSIQLIVKKSLPKSCGLFSDENQNDMKRRLSKSF